MPVEMLVQIGITAAKLVAQAVEAIAKDANLTAVERAVALDALEGELIATKAAVAAVRFREV